MVHTGAPGIHLDTSISLTYCTVYSIRKREVLLVQIGRRKIEQKVVGVAQG